MSVSFMIANHSACHISSHIAQKQFAVNLEELLFWHAQLGSYRQVIFIDGPYSLIYFPLGHPIIHQAALEIMISSLFLNTG